MSFLNGFGILPQILPCSLKHFLTQELAGTSSVKLLRSGTSPAPNYDEACVAESRRDFAHKVSVAAKEMRESRGWIRFCAKANLVEWKQINSLEDEADQLLRMLAKSARTAKTQGDHKPDQ
jgi:four helix bundle protein